MFRTIATPMAMISLLTATAGCGGRVATVSPSQTPAWFQEKLDGIPQQGYPSLQSVPQLSAAPAPEAQYRALERELWNERTRIEASPRAEEPPAPVASAESAEAFERDVRERIETSRSRDETAPPVPLAPL